MIDKLDQIRKTIIMKDLDFTSLTNYTGISQSKLEHFIEGENIIDDVEMKILYMRIITEKCKLIKTKKELLDEIYKALKGCN